MKKKSLRLLLGGALLGTALVTASAAYADEAPASVSEVPAIEAAEEADDEPVVFETADGVLSIEVPSVDWQVVEDPNYWFTLSDGDDLITLSHLSNGEALPAVEVANETYKAIYQAFASTENEVFVVKGAAAKAEDLEDIMKAIGTIRILKFDTKTALEKETAPVSAFGLRKIGETYYVTANELNVRTGCSTDYTSIAKLNKGDQVKVLGAVTKDGQDFGWYQIDYKGTTAYVSASYLSKTKPEEPKKEEKKEEKKTEPKKEESGKDEPKKEEPKPAEEPKDWFTVYAKDGSRVNIYMTGDLFEDADGHKYSNVRGDLYVNMDTDVQYSADINYWADGEPQPDQEPISEEGALQGVIEPTPEEPKTETPAPTPEEPKTETPAPAPEEPKAETPAPVPEEPKVEEPAPAPAPEEPKKEEPKKELKEVKVYGEEGESFTIRERDDGFFYDGNGTRFELKNKESGLYLRTSDQVTFSEKAEYWS